MADYSGAYEGRPKISCNWCDKYRAKVADLELQVKAWNDKYEKQAQAFLEAQKISNLRRLEAESTLAALRAENADLKARKPETVVHNHYHYETKTAQPLAPFRPYEPVKPVWYGGTINANGNQ